MSKVRLAILGCGGMAGAHAQRFRSHPDATIVACCDVQKDIVDSFIARHLAELPAKPAVFTDPAEMYRTAKPDAVVIVTPHTLHAAHGAQALAAGCHVFMEKPMVTDQDQAHALAASAAAAKKILVVGYNSSCSPELRYVRDAIRKRTFGKLELVSGYLSQDWMRLTAGSWRQKPELSGGGQAYDSGAHLFNSLCWSVEADVGEVFAYVDNHGTPVDINSVVAVRFANGVLANIAIGGNCRSDGCNLTYLFENGRIDVDGWGGGWIKVHGLPAGQEPVLPGARQSPNDNFIDAVLGRAEPLTSPRNGIIQSELMDAIYESARTGRPARPKPRG